TRGPASTEGGPDGWGGDRTIRDQGGGFAPTPLVCFSQYEGCLAAAGQQAPALLRLITQFSLAPEKVTTLRHFSVSSARRVPKSSAVPGSGLPPKSVRRAFRTGCAKPRLISRFSNSVISGAVPRGAPTPNQALASYPFTKSP